IFAKSPRPEICHILINERGYGYDTVINIGGYSYTRAVTGLHASGYM
ncbi:hypothetical protein L915_21708, partial [Phytophthora nicotianae]